MVEELSGKVKKVYIPVKDGEDIILCNKIAFVVETDEGLMDIYGIQNEKTIRIQRDDDVIISKQKIDGKNCYTIRKQEV